MLKKKLTQEELDNITANLPKALDEEQKKELIDNVFFEIKKYLNAKSDTLQLIIDKLDDDKSLDLIANQIQSKFAVDDLLMYIEILHRQFVDNMTFFKLQQNFNTFYSEIKDSSVEYNKPINVKEDICESVSEKQIEEI